MLERLQKIISRAGIASRRHAEDLIRSGQVRVNGVVVTELGAKADPERDRVEAAGKLARRGSGSAYILLHKPPQVVSTLADPEGRRTLRHLLPGVSERVYPVGRLDYAASGLVLLTNDGEFAARVLHAAPRLSQTYWMKVKGRLTAEEIRSIAEHAHARIRPLGGTHGSKANPWYEIVFSGASRDALRKLLTARGHPVEKMKRVGLGSIDLGTLPEGSYRRVDRSEVESFAHSVERATTEPVVKSAARLRGRSRMAPRKGR